MLSAHGKNGNRIHLTFLKNLLRKCFLQQSQDTQPCSNQGDREVLYSELHAYGKFTGLCWLLSPEPNHRGSTCPNAGRAYFFLKNFSLYLLLLNN